MSVLLTSTGTSQTWSASSVPPAGTRIKAEGWGPGSGGSRGTSNGAGGSGGAYAVAPAYVVTPNDVANGISFSIPAGGAGAGAANSSAPGDTSWSTNNLNTFPSTDVSAAVPGTPGTWPTNWGILADAGLTTSIIGVGIDAGTGLPYIDVRWFGTTNSTAFQWAWNSATNPTCSASVQWTGSFYFAVVGGTTTNCTDLNNQIQSGPDFFDNYLGGPPWATSLNSVSPAARVSTTVTMTATARTDAYLSVIITCNSGAAVDITLRIAAPQFEQAAAASFWKSTPGYCLAKGGGGTSGGTGGTGGAAASCIPSTGAFSGGNGATRTQGGGGGGAAGPDGAGGNASSATGGTGDGGNVTGSGTSDARGGSGGLGSTSTDTAGGTPGAGGGGQTSGTTGTGSAGGPGRIKLTWVLSASASPSFFSLACVATAAQQTSITASASCGIESLSCVASAQEFDQAHASISLLGLVASGLINQLDQASSRLSLFSLSSVSYVSDWSYALAGFETLSAIASASQSDVATALSNIETIRAAGSITQYDQATASSLIAFQSAGFLSQFDQANGLALFFILTDVASISDWAYSASSILSLTGSGQSVQLDLASGTSSLLQLSALAQAGQFDLANAFATIEPISAQGSISLWCYGSDTLALSCVGQAAQYDQASCALTFASISASGFLLPSTNASAATSLEVLSVSAAAQQYDVASGVAAALPLSCIATSPDWCLSTNAVLTLSATGFAGQGTVCFSRSGLLGFSSVASAQAPVGVSALATVQPLTAVGAISIAAYSRASIDLTSLAVLGQSDGVVASASINLAAAGSISNWCSGLASVGVSASGRASQSDLAAASGFISWSASGLCLLSFGASCSSSLLAFSSTANSGQSDSAIGLASFLALGASGAVSDWAYSAAQVSSLAATGQAVQGLLVSCAASALSLSSVVAAGQTISAVVSVSIDLAADAGLTQQNLASTITGLPDVYASGAAIFSRPALGDGAIYFSGLGALGQSDPVSSILAWDLECQGIVDVSLLASGIAAFLFDGSAAAFQGSGTPAHGAGIIPSLFAHGQIRTFAQGGSREVFFDGDSRLVYWPPYGGDVVSLFNADATKAANRVVSWS
jgi:hypothetical protein